MPIERASEAAARMPTVTVLQAAVRMPTVTVLQAAESADRSMVLRLVDCPTAWQESVVGYLMVAREADSKMVSGEETAPKDDCLVARRVAPVEREDSPMVVQVEPAADQRPALRPPGVAPVGCRDPVFAARSACP